MILVVIAFLASSMSPGMPLEDLVEINGPVTGPEVWRLLVEEYFEPDQVDTAMRVMACESGGNPDAKNPRSSASGLFQHLTRYWDFRAEAAGFAGADVFDPEANIAAAAWLSSNHSWHHWTCY